MDGHTIRVVPWSLTYADWLRDAIRQFFEVGLGRGGDVLPTVRNIDLYLKIGLDGAARGDACLLALVNEQPVAYVMWVGSPDVLDTRHKVVNAIGSYTDPAYRQRAIATALREEAIRLSKLRGYEKAVGPVLNTNERGIREFCTAYNAWPMSTNFEYYL